MLTGAAELRRTVLVLVLGVAGTAAAQPAAPPSPPLNCPCIHRHPDGVPRTSSGALIITDSAFNKHKYPNEYGVKRCDDHDKNLPPYCDTQTASGKYDAEANPRWCTSLWCYIDPNDCNVGYSASKYVPGVELIYSYAACSSANDFDADFEEMRELTIKRALAGTLFGVVIPIIWALPVLILFHTEVRRACGFRCRAGRLCVCCGRGPADTTASATSTTEDDSSFGSSAAPSSIPPLHSGSGSGRIVVADLAPDHEVTRPRSHQVSRSKSRPGQLASLNKSEEAGKALRRRVSGAAAQFGWMLTSVGLIPLLFAYTGILDVQNVAGSVAYYACAGPWGIALMVVALRPIDASAVRKVCRQLAGGFMLLALAFGFIMYRRLREGNVIGAVGVFGCLLTMVTASGLLMHTLRVRLRPSEAGAPRELLAPRQVLMRVWLAVRLAMLAFAGIGTVYYLIPALGLGGDVVPGTTPESWLAMAASFLLAALFFTPRNRGRLLARLGRRGKGGSAQQEAASVPRPEPRTGRTGPSASPRARRAPQTPPRRCSRCRSRRSSGRARRPRPSTRPRRTLHSHTRCSVPGAFGAQCTTQAAALRVCCRYFRGQPLGLLTREHLVDNRPDPSLYQLSVPAALGEVHAFVSHSWRDDGSAKYDCLHEWAGEHRIDCHLDCEEHRVAAGGAAGGDAGAILIWLDKACIDQLNITIMLACLPVFIAGCEQLLVLAGPTYASRLWCVMELFVYVRMGGKPEETAVKLLHHDDVLFEESLVRFDAAKAACFLDRDRQRLLAVIESTFGDTEAFNHLVREMFDQKLFAGSIKRKRTATRSCGLRRSSNPSPALQCSHSGAPASPPPKLGGGGGPLGRPPIVV